MYPQHPSAVRLKAPAFTGPWGLLPASWERVGGQCGGQGACRAEQDKVHPRRDRGGGEGEEGAGEDGERGKGGEREERPRETDRNSASRSGEKRRQATASSRRSFAPPSPAGAHLVRAREGALETDVCIGQPLRGPRDCDPVTPARARARTCLCWGGPSRPGAAPAAMPPALTARCCPGSPRLRAGASPPPRPRPCGPDTRAGTSCGAGTLMRVPVDGLGTLCREAIPSGTAAGKPGASPTAHPAPHQPCAGWTQRLCCRETRQEEVGV